MYFMNYHLVWLLLLIPALAVLLVYWQRPVVSLNLRRMHTLQPKRRQLKNILFLVSLFFIIVALLRPQWGLRTELRETKGVDMVIALDVSKSMHAEDVLPDRLTRARMCILDLLSRIPGNRVGLVVFAGSASAVCPLTTDYDALAVFLQSLNNYTESTPGTNIENAFRVSEKLFEDKALQDKVWLLLTDGESHEGSVAAVRALAASKQIIVAPIAVGTPGGQPVPDYDEQGMRLGYKKDSKGAIVISHLDRASLAKLATMPQPAVRAPMPTAPAMGVTLLERCLRSPGASAL